MMIEWSDIATMVLWTAFGWSVAKYSIWVYMRGVQRGIQELNQNMCKGSLYVDVIAQDGKVLKEIRFEALKEKVKND
jgi:hypothetical protein